MATDVLTSLLVIITAFYAWVTGVKGVQRVGRIPQELQTWIGFAGGVCSAARQPEAARNLLRFFTTPGAGRVLEAAGLEPFIE